MGLSDDVRDESSGAIEISLGDTILRTMTGSATNPEVGPARFAGSGELDDVAQIVGQIADRILVAEPSAGDREVRIVLKDSVLPATEIRLSQAEGKLQLQFVTDSPVAQSILQNNHDALQTRLQGITGKSVAVTIGSDAGGNDASQDQRSRGYRESLGVEEDE
ncbi:MAG: type III secretion HpaP family protein [Planctomycetota bacterium]